MPGDVSHCLGQSSVLVEFDPDPQSNYTKTIGGAAFVNIASPDVIELVHQGLDEYRLFLSSHGLGTPLGPGMYVDAVDPYAPSPR